MMEEPGRGPWRIHLPTYGTWSWVHAQDVHDGRYSENTIEEIGDSIASEFSQLLHKGASATASFANMNTYDCDLFDEEGHCYSIGGRSHRCKRLITTLTRQAQRAECLFGVKSLTRTFALQGLSTNKSDRKNARRSKGAAIKDL